MKSFFAVVMRVCPVVRHVVYTMTTGLRNAGMGDAARNGGGNRNARLADGPGGRDSPRHFAGRKAAAVSDPAQADHNIHPADFSAAGGGGKTQNLQVFGRRVC